jgi:hypothetical protein
LLKKKHEPERTTKTVKFSDDVVTSNNNENNVINADNKLQDIESINGDNN